MLFISLALSLLLVALIVIALKNNQQRRLEDLADREQSLPPLSDNNAAHQVDALPVPDSSPAHEAAPPQPVPESPSVQDATEQQVDTSGQPALDWKQICREHRQAQQFEQALSAAELAWPQAQSYEQTALTIRAALKQTPPADLQSIEHWLTRLHRAAAECSLLHDKLPEDIHSRRRSGDVDFTREELRHVELPWQEIGSEKLKLLTKTDRKLMIQLWGEPLQHVSAKCWYQTKLKP